MSNGEDKAAVIESRSAADSRHQVQLVSKAEAVLDRSLAYQAAQAVHELKASLGIDIEEIHLIVSLIPQAPGTYRVSCAIVSPRDIEPLKLEMVVNPDDRRI